MPGRRDQLSQRALIVQLRLLLDPTCENLACGHARCAQRRIALAFVLVRNPHSVWSTKVLHNIGKARLRKLLVHTKPPSKAARARVRARLANSMRATRRALVAPDHVSSDPQ